MLRCSCFGGRCISRCTRSPGETAASEPRKQPETLKSSIRVGRLTVCPDAPCHTTSIGTWTRGLVLRSLFTRASTGSPRGTIGQLRLEIQSLDGPNMSACAVPHRALAEDHSDLQCVDIWTPERLVVVAGYIPRLRSPMCRSSRWVTRNPVIPSVSTADRGCDVTSVPFTKKRTWELPTSTASVFDDRP